MLNDVFNQAAVISSQHALILAPRAGPRSDWPAPTSVGTDCESTREGVSTYPGPQAFLKKRLGELRHRGPPNLNPGELHFSRFLTKCASIFVADDLRREFFQFIAGVSEEPLAAGCRAKVLSPLTIDHLVPSTQISGLL